MAEMQPEVEESKRGILQFGWDAICVQRPACYGQKAPSIIYINRGLQLADEIAKLQNHDTD